MKTSFKRATFYLMACVLNALLLGTSITVHGQTNFGRISGTVTDVAGANVPNATVTVTNEETQISRTAPTDVNGFYVVTNLPVGSYAVATEFQGFKKMVKTGNNLVSDGRVTINFALEPGEVAETVTVSTSAGETVNTTSGEVARVVDAEQVQNLALNARNYLQLTTLIPGVPLIDDDQLALTTNVNFTYNINGQGAGTNTLTVDGGYNSNSGSNTSQINNVGVDFIQEVKVQTSNFSAEYGRHSGAAINVTTRSGTNKFHGSGWEFFRHDKLDANSFFSNAAGRFTDNPSAPPQLRVPPGDPRVGRQVVERRPLRFNNYGFSLGGPIFKNKLFFFTGYEAKRIRRSVGPILRTIPTRAERTGDLSFRLRGPDGVVGTADDGVLRDPTTTLPCTAPVLTGGAVVTPADRRGCFPGNIIPASRITTDGRAIAMIYGAMEARAGAFVDLPIGNNALFLEPNPFNWWEVIGRIDYKLSDRQTLYGRYLHDDYDLIDPFGTFISAPLPTIPTNRVRPGTSAQLGHTWQVTSKMINEARATAAWLPQRTLPEGDVWKREPYGFTFPQLFPGGLYPNGIPDISITGLSSIVGPAGTNQTLHTDISFTDNLTWLKGPHTFKSGVLLIRNRIDQGASSDYLGDISFSTAGNSRSTGNALADSLLGNFRTYSEASDKPIPFYRFTQLEAFLMDTWRVRPGLSLEMGLRWQRIEPTYTQANNMANFDPRLYDPARAVTLRPDGTIDTSRGGNRFNGLIRAGDGIPSQEVGRVITANSPEVQGVPAGAPRGFVETRNLFAPRFSFAWSPFKDSKTALRGGFGMFYHKFDNNLIFPLGGSPPFVLSKSFENGNLSDPTGGVASRLTPFVTIAALDPNLDVPYVMNWSLGVQRELPYGVFFEAAYVGNVGRHLVRIIDINQPTFEALVANAALPSSQRATTNFLRPFKGYSGINMRMSDSNSNYNAMQLYAAKRKGDLTMTASYTWSKTLTDAASGEDPFNKRFNYGPTSFDRRHIFVTTYTYRLPFFRKSSGFVKNVLAGWEISGITRLQSGQSLTVSGSTSIGTRRADYIGGDVSIPNPTADQWFNAEAFARAPDGRRGTAGIGQILGPGYYSWDLSVRKRFKVGERLRFLLQGDFFNAFNHTNFGNPSTNVSSGDFGSIGSARAPRNIQLGLKLNF